MRRLAAALAIGAASFAHPFVYGQQEDAQPRPQPGVVAARAVPAPHFEYIGPTSAGRIAAAAAVAGKPGVYYAGAASGGVWKSGDGGATWKPTFDKETSQALGRATGPQKERGVFRTDDGGKTWQQVLFVDENTGCSGLVAAFTSRATAAGRSPGSQIRGCRNRRTGRLMSPSDGNRMYALIQARRGELASASAAGKVQRAHDAQTASSTRSRSRCGAT